MRNAECGMRNAGMPNAGMRNAEKKNAECRDPEKYWRNTQPERVTDPDSERELQNKLSLWV